MKLSTSDLTKLANLAISAAMTAGEMIAQSRPQEVEHKAGGTSLASQVVTEIDRRSEDLILGVLNPTLERFELGLLTEEQDDDRSRLTADHFWSIDPLDGTLPFIEGVPGYAVSIALVKRDGTPCIGVVYDPVDGTLMHAILGGGVFWDRQPWTSASTHGGAALSVFLDRSFLTSDGYEDLVDSLVQISKEMGCDTVQIREPRGAVMNACGVLANAPACYIKLPKPADGGGSSWDFAATACLFNEAGAVATDIHGETLELNRTDSTYMNHRGVLFATDQALALRIQAMGNDAS